MEGQTNPIGKKVFVGMSGGVDSSVSAALLRERGFDVTGVFIKVWQPDWMECTWREDRLDAMRVAAVLDIPFVTLDLEKEYKREVVDDMIAQYKAGRTPNPDVLCNRHVKFGGFFDWAMAQGADFVATGHYAQVQGGDAVSGAVRLLSGRDSGKDQSYFLWQLSAKVLARTLFPVGGMEKAEVRRLAVKFDLPNAAKRDSQGLCFVGRVDMKEFLGHYIAARKGGVLDDCGEVIGEHDGAIFLTLGERRGFSVTRKTATDAPYYVTARDIDKNTVTVSHKAVDGSLPVEKKEVVVDGLNWIGEMPEIDKPYTARIRHLGELLSCELTSIKKGRAELTFTQPLVISPGQSVVIYNGEICLGGGIAL
ncbi:MAG: tRNA 2-thiouridine(34) synthase MnmA [Candidatus Paceibacterota bacterium]|jgi:tRNA-specific 2-thiouridylase